ncbi:argininosuccinate lyase [Cupriavidus cauae]|uniref:argininosuccinate lyase n=1 Tax=Cupriavidus cauae TaxID=2608999 RepID=UPI002244B1C5|nr:argininosuccinate lyase [Cupriavidus cauae]UZN52115.1 argininosuccinate lyase [Cupriavidus cauae]
MDTNAIDTTYGANSASCATNSTANHTASKVSRRLQQATAPEVCELIYLPRLNRDFASGFSYLTDINQAHLLMLHAAGLVPRAMAARIARALEEIERAGPDAVPLDPAREDAYFNYEAQLMQTAGADAGGRLHVARSRNDILATHDRLRARDAGLALLEAIQALRATTLTMARQHADTVMPGYTHLQAAQPITYGYYLVGLADAFARDAERLLRALDALDACPLGAGALAGTAFPIQREETARLLGFSRCVANGLDAVASRDFAWEMMSAMTIAAVGWSRIAQDYFVWSTPEFGLIDFPDSVAGTSSIMPQKKNPVVLEYLKGKGAHLTGLLTAALSTVKGTNFSHTGDGNRESMRSFWECADECLRSARLLTLVIGSATPLRDNMLLRARRDFSAATDLADALVREADLSFREAHHIVGAVVRQALDAQLPADRITSDMVDIAARQQIGRAIGLSEEAVQRCLDPVQGVRARMAAGGPSPTLVRARLVTMQAELDAAAAELAARRRAVASARETLKRENAALAATPA